MEPFFSRQRAWQSLTSEVFDLLVIGGGITGAGIARDAALRGLKVALVEKGDFGSGTSSKSSKLIHGGLRYLERLQFGLVFESLQERKRMLTLAPHLVAPLPFLVPQYQGQKPGACLLHAGLWLYDILSGFSSPRHRMLGKTLVATKEPALNKERLKGGAVYFDHQTRDARLTLENIMDASLLGATVLSYAEVTLPYSGSSVLSETQDGKTVSTIEVKDFFSGQVIQARAKVVVFALGPWTDKASSQVSFSPLLRPTKGVHVVLDAARLPVSHAVVMKAPQDGRVVFALPWHEPTHPTGHRTVLGTTDTDFQGDPDAVFANQADVGYLLDCANSYFPQTLLTKDDVISTWAGLRPLIAPPKNVSASSISREHEIVIEPFKITIAGGKLTTYRNMARQVVDAAVVQLGYPLKKYPCNTHKRFLPQGIHPSELDPIWLREKGALLGLSPLQVEHVISYYGARAKEFMSRLETLPPGYEQPLDPELPYFMAQVDFAVLCEMANRLTDVLSRRITIQHRAKDQGLFCAKAVAKRMAMHLGWDEDRIQKEVSHYQVQVEQSRLFRTESTMM